MQLKIGKHDIIYVDRGANRKDGEPRYVVVVDDEDKGFTDGANGGHTEYGAELLAGYLDSEAYKQGARPVVTGSKCVVGGYIHNYSDDVVGVFNANEKVMFVEDELANLLVQEGVAKFTQV